MAHTDVNSQITNAVIAPTITITRHAAQAVLHHALDTQPEACCGLLYGLSDETGITINRAIPTANIDEARLSPPEESDREEELLGLYRSFPSAGTTTDDMLAGMPSPLRTTGLLYAAISLSTEGRLEIDAFCRTGEAWREQPLQMVEDGTLYQMPYTG